MKRKKGTLLLVFLITAALAVSALALTSFLRSAVPTVGEFPSADEYYEETETEKKAPDIDLDSLAAFLSDNFGREFTSLEMSRAGDEINLRLYEHISETELSADDFKLLTGYTVNAFLDKFGSMQSRDMSFNGKDTFTLGFTGDVNFTETGYVMTHARNMPGGVIDCIDETFRSEMESADIMLVNNEFPYSDRGSPTPDKKYTFRADPANVHYLNDLGVDIVSLGNNHTYDYGYESFVDTLSTLKKAGIPYVGAGMTISEASAPVSFIINGYKVSYLACSGVEWPIKTPVATQTSCGIMGSYDGGEAMKEAVEEAKKTSDYVIVFPHWGYENTTELTSAQISCSRKWIDAGADAVIGCHAHILQGVDYYKGAPIAYGLGNFWFNTKNVPTVLYKLIIGSDGIKTQIVPGRQANSETRYMDDPADRRALYDSIISWSPGNNAEISDDGFITEKIS